MTSCPNGIPPLRSLPMNRGLFWLLMISLVVRAVFMFAQYENLKQDPDAYRALAEELRTSGVYGRRFPTAPRENASPALREVLLPTAYRPPLYPVLLDATAVQNGILSLPRTAILHLLLGLATVWLTYHLGEQLNLGLGSHCAALLTACDPILLQQSTLIMTETLATFLAVGSLVMIVLWWKQPSIVRALLAGGLIGLATLCRPTFLPWGGLLIGTILLLGWQTRRWEQLGQSFFFALGISLTLIPWGIRNRLEIGEFRPTTTHGGYTFALGNSTAFFEHLRSGKSLETFQLSPNPHENRPGSIPAVPRDECREDAAYYTQAFRDIQREPRMFCLACAFRWYQLFNPLPHPTCEFESRSRAVARYLVCGWYCVFYLFTILGLLKLRKQLAQPPWIFGSLLIVVWIAVHTFYWTNLRMRAPLMPFLAVMAAVGVRHYAEPWLRTAWRRIFPVREPS